MENSKPCKNHSQGSCSNFSFHLVQCSNRTIFVRDLSILYFTWHKIHSESVDCSRNDRALPFAGSSLEKLQIETFPILSSINYNFWHFYY